MTHIMAVGRVTGIRHSLVLLRAVTLFAVVYGAPSSIAAAQVSLDDVDKRIGDLQATIAQQRLALEGIDKRVADLQTNVAQLKRDMDSNAWRAFAIVGAAFALAWCIVGVVRERARKEEASAARDRAVDAELTKRLALAFGAMRDDPKKAAGITGVDTIAAEVKALVDAAMAQIQHGFGRPRSATADRP